MCGTCTHTSYIHAWMYVCMYERICHVQISISRWEHSHKETPVEIIYYFIHTCMYGRYVYHIYLILWRLLFLCSDWKPCPSQSLRHVSTVNELIKVQALQRQSPRTFVYRYQQCFLSSPRFQETAPSKSMTSSFIQHSSCSSSNLFWVVVLLVLMSWFFFQLFVLNNNNGSTVTSRAPTFIDRHNSQKSPEMKQC